MNSGLYDALIAEQLLIPHVEVPNFEQKQSDQSIIIKPEEIPYISYCYEWCFSQLKDAALLTLSIQKLALAHNMSLKDASAFNIQFYDGKPVFIDTLSFEDFSPGPWVAYKQFCQHFLAPLTLIAYKDRRLSKYSTNHIDGLPLDLTSKLLPWRSYFNLGILFHIHMHARYQAKHNDDSKRNTTSRNLTINKEKMIAMISQIESTIKNLKWKSEKTEWRDYYSNTNYQTDAMDQKKLLVETYLKTIQPSPLLTLDLGANNGEFSHLAAKFSGYVVSQDIDESAVEANYTHCKDSGTTNVLPLIQDLTNPTPP
ncbi:MAG: class I SAM-dependent methyltransferase, partial [Gammaproteobacteria bacterium]